MLLGRRDLDVPVPGGPERIGAGLGDGLEAPLEEDGGDVLVTGRRGDGLRCRAGEGGCGKCGRGEKSCSSDGSGRHAGGLLAEEVGIAATVGAR